MNRVVTVVLLALISQLGFAQEPRVVASIKPIYALVAGVMAGVGSPELLMRSGASAHHYSLRPSEARRLADADVIFWVGPRLEVFLVRPLASADGVRSVELLGAPGVLVLPLRVGGVDDEQGSTAIATGEHDGENEGHDGHDHGGATDPHIWLDPRNAVAMVLHISAVLSELYPSLQPNFERNTTALVAHLDRLDATTRTDLEPVRSVPYLVFHDAYQYYERRYDLNVLGAVVLSPERRPGARRLREVRARIRESGARCVFSEPQFQSSLVATVIEGTDAGSAVLDPLGAELEAGPESYFTLIRSLTRALRDCLGTN